MITRIKISFVAVLSIAALVLLDTQALAQAIPAEMLAADSSEVFTDCKARDEEDFVCELLANCITRHFENDMDLAMYLSMREQLEANAVTNDLRMYLDQVAVVCMADLETALANR